MTVKPMQTSRVALSLVLWMFCASASGAIESGKWFRYQSANFQVYSTLSEAKVARRIRDLEAFRAMVQFYTGTNKQTVAAHPTKLMLLSRSSDIKKYYKHENVGGFYQSAKSYNLMVAAPFKKRNRAAIRARDHDNEIIFHEYIHYLLRNAASSAYPTWYDEGVADLFGAMVFENLGEKDAKAVIGLVSESQSRKLSDFGDMKVAELLSVVDATALTKDENAQFYSLSWLLVHYLNLSSEARDEGLSRRVPDFLRLFNEGVAIESAFFQAFQLAPEDFDARLAAYKKTSLPSFSVPLSRLDYEIAYSRVALSKSEITDEFGYQLLFSNQPYARRLFEKNLKRAPDSPRALVGMAAALQEEGAYDVAETHILRAIDLAPDDYQTHLAYADLIGRKCSATEWENCGFDNPANQFLSYAEKAHELQPDTLHVNVTYAQALQVVGKYRELIPVLHTSLEISPSAYPAIAMLGIAHLSLGEPEKAEPYLVRAMAWASQMPELAALVGPMLEQLRATP